MPSLLGTVGLGDRIPQIRNPSRPNAARQMPTIVARLWVRIGSWSITASLRTSADCIRRSTKRYAWTCDLVVGVDAILGSLLSQSRYGSAGYPDGGCSVSGLTRPDRIAPPRTSSSQSEGHRTP